jgi:hypothetical protein
MANKVIYRVELGTKWKSNINKRTFTALKEYNISSNRGAEFAIMKAKSFALKQRERGVNGVEEKPYDDSCIEVELASVSPALTVDC